MLADAYADGAEEQVHSVRRVVATMGMLALAYRWYFRALCLKSLERNILGFVGFARIHETLVGGVDQMGEQGVAQWLARLRQLGRQAA